MSFTDYAKRTEYKPVDFFFRGIADIKSRKVLFVDAYQILNDRFLGRMNVCNYFFIAENSSRINELNAVALDELKNYHLVMRENFCIPAKTAYSLQLTTRFLENDKSFQALLDMLKDNGYKRGSLILNFNCNTLTHIDADAKKRYARLKKTGLKICVSGFGEEYNSLDLLADFKFDYLRAEANYFTAEPSKKNLLQMLVKFCSASKIGLIMEDVNSPAQMARFKRSGVKIVTGRAVSKLSRWVTNSFLGLSELDEQQKTDYLEKMQRDLKTAAAKSMIEISDISREIKEKIDMERKMGKIIPSTPRPELLKSPYQVRLEKQKQNALKAAERLSNSVKNVNKSTADEKANASLNANESADEKANASLSANESADEKANASLSANESADEKANASLNANESADEKANECANKNIVGENLNLSEQGVLNIENKTEAVIVSGHYNDEGKWVDKDGTVYDGYFDDDGGWNEYEVFNAEQEGHYNENAQWVDKDGTVYDGYFDEQGRWIDYTYTTESGEVVDNGYFDKTIGKWVPFGYFDEKGNYIAF